MKIRCNVCGGHVNKIKLPEQFGQEAYCNNCCKLLAYVDDDIIGVLHWVVVDNRYDELHEYVPCEIIGVDYENY